MCNMLVIANTEYASWLYEEYLGLLLYNLRVIRIVNV